MALCNEQWRAALAATESWRRRKGVVSVHVGQRLRDGRYPPEARSETCLVVTVREKLGEQALLRVGRKPFPPSVRFRYGEAELEAPVDVQLADDELERQSAVGRQVEAGPGPQLGAVGLVVARDGAPYLMTAAHVALELGGTVRTPLGAATVARRWEGRRLDHALLSVPGELPGHARLLRDGRTLARVRQTDFQLIGAEVHLFHAASGLPETAIVRDVGVRVPSDGSGFWDLIRTDLCSLDGDSGTLLFDAEPAAIGTLVGRTRSHSFFLPCDSALLRIGATPIL